MPVKEQKKKEKGGTFLFSKAEALVFLLLGCVVARGGQLRRCVSCWLLSLRRLLFVSFDNHMPLEEHLDIHWRVIFFSATSYSSSSSSFFFWGEFLSFSIRFRERFVEKSHVPCCWELTKRWNGIAEFMKVFLARGEGFSLGSNCLNFLLIFLEDSLDILKIVTKIYQNSWICSSILEFLYDLLLEKLSK